MRPSTLQHIRRLRVAWLAIVIACTTALLMAPRALAEEAVPLPAHEEEALVEAAGLEEKIDSQEQRSAAETTDLGDNADEVIVEEQVVEHEPVVSEETDDGDTATDVIDGADAASLGEDDGAATDTAEEAAPEEVAAFEEPASAAPAESVLDAQAGNTPDAPQNATVVDEGTYVIQSKVADNRVVGAKGASPAAGANVATATYTGKNNQQWVVRREDDSLWYRLYVGGSSDKRALAAVKDSTGAVNVAVVDVSATEAQSLLSMLWSFVDINDGCFRLINAAWQGLCLEVAGSNKAEGANIALGTAKRASVKRQCFALFKRNPEVAAGDVKVSGSYMLELSGTSLVADVDASGKANGANAQVSAKSGSGTQRIYLERDARGFYTAWVVGTGMVLESQASSIISGDNVRQAAHKGTSCQLWALAKVISKDGAISYTLQNKQTGLFLGAADAKSGSNLCGLGAGEPGRGFVLVPTTLLSPGIYEIKPQTSKKTVLQVKNSSTKKAGLVLAAASNALSQKFELVSAGGSDTWRVRTGSSGGWLTWLDGTKIMQVGKGKSKANARNTWRAVWKDGGIVLLNVASELAGRPRALGTRLGKLAKGTPVVANVLKSSALPHFSYEPSQLVAEGFYFFKNSGGKYLQVKGTSAKNKANIVMASATGGMGQYFKVEYKNGYTKIANIFSQKYLQAVKSKAGSNVEQRKEKNTKLQLWKSVISDGGKVMLVNVANPKVTLGATKGGRKSGANVRVETLKSRKGQTWKPIELGSKVMKGKKSGQKAVVRAAKNTESPGYGLCAAWVTYVFENAGFGTWGGDACDQYRDWCNSSNLNKLRPGMIVAVSSHSHTPAGSIWGHVCVYVGNGKIMDNVGYIRTMSLVDWIAWYGDTVTPMWGWIGGVQLS